MQSRRLRMSEQDKSGQARKGLIDSVKGKAKEVVGALTNNDSLTAEGQLEQTQAKERKEANRVETVADAEADQARAEVTEARTGGRPTAERGERRDAGRREHRARRPSRTEARGRTSSADGMPSGRRRGPISTRSSRCNTRRTWSARRSTPRPRRPSTPPQNIRARCRLPTVPKQRLTASDARPTT